MDIQLFEWQKKAIEKAKGKKGLALFAEQGTGKTLTAIRLLDDHYTGGNRILIFAPLVTLGNWGEEIKKFGKKINDIPIHVHQRAKTHQTISMTNLPAGIIILNYEALRNNDLYHALVEWSPTEVVVDESHNIKNHKSIQSRKICTIAENAYHKYILSGTPVLNSVKDLFGQFLFLDPSIFGKNFFVFRATYMRDANAGWASNHKYFPKWEDREDAYETVQKKISPISIRVLKKDCLDLPPLIKQKLYVEMTKDQYDLYHDMKNDCIAFIKGQDLENPAIAQTALTKILRLQQIASGFIKLENGEEVPVTDSRGAVCMDLVETILKNPSSKVIIWCCFKQNYSHLSKLLARAQIEHVLLTGEQNQQAKERAMDDFRTKNSIRVMIANRRAGGIGVNLVSADYSIVYSRNFSLADELQSEARNYRAGSEIHDKIVKIDMITKDSVDEVIYQALAHKNDVSVALIDNLKKELV